MKLVFDTNVIVDVIARRSPFFYASKKAMEALARKDVVGALTANTLTDIFYIVKKHQANKELQKVSLLDLMDCFEVLDTTRLLCLAAIRSSIADFEDALMAESAKQWRADYIVTRDVGGFSESPVPAISPEGIVRCFS